MKKIKLLYMVDVSGSMMFSILETKNAVIKHAMTTREDFANIGYEIYDFDNNVYKGITHKSTDEEVNRYKAEFNRGGTDILNALSFIEERSMELNKKGCRNILVYMITDDIGIFGLRDNWEKLLNVAANIRRNTFGLCVVHIRNVPVELLAISTDYRIVFDNNDKTYEKIKNALTSMTDEHYWRLFYPVD